MGYLGSFENGKKKTHRKVHGFPFLMYEFELLSGCGGGCGLLLLLMLRLHLLARRDHGRINSHARNGLPGEDRIHAVLIKPFSIRFVFSLLESSLLTSLDNLFA